MQFPVKLLFKQWANLKGQLAFIYNTLLVAPEVISFSLFATRKIITSDDFSSAPGSIRNISGSLISSTWNCLDLLEFTGMLIDTEYFEDVKPIFEMASRQCPELLCIGLASLNPSWNSINKEILVKLTCGFLIGQASSLIVLPKVWALNPNTMLVCMAEMHRRDATCLSRLLDVAQELKIIPFLLDAKPFNFAIDVAALASRRQHLNLEKWISDSIRDRGPAFLQACVEFVSEKIKFQVKRQRGIQTSPFIPLSNEVLGVFLRILQANVGAMSPECVDEFRELQKILGAETVAQASQVGSPLAATQDLPGLPSGASAVEFPADIEEEVNSFFDRLFGNEISIPEVIDVLQKMRGSANPRDQQVFSCLINNIFDEYRFFPKYPEGELILTATLFGQIIACQLISFGTLGTALRCVLEALKKPPGQKMFKFGLHALMQFQGRLAEWPQFSAHVLQIPNLQQIHPDLFNFVRGCLAGGPSPAPAEQQPPPPDAKKAPAQAPQPASSDSLTSISVSTLLEAADKQTIIVPNEQVRDRILFIVNNISMLNLEGKANDLVKILQEAYYPWMAQYLVIKRASIEPNFHHLYGSFLEVLQLHRLEEQILRQTFGNIFVLLRSAKTDTSSSERSLLKNLGSWLGGLTLARNRPILYADLCLKKLLVDAHRTNRLIVVIPFVCKVMESCAKSRVFLPNNPWLMAVLGLLVELYHFADLKLNLKFEVEVLCKSLGVELKGLQPSNLIRANPSPERRATKLEPMQLSEPSAAVPSSFESLIAFNPNIMVLHSSSTLRKIVLFAVEYAIREIVLSVAERAISIAGSTTRTLVMKDLGREADDNVIKSAARQMVQSLAANLALVTSRDPIKPAIIHNIRAFVQITGLGSRLNDAAIQTIAEDNLDLASAYVERSSMDKAFSDILGLLETDLATRDKSKLKNNIGAGIDSAKLAVYQEFNKITRPKLPPINLTPVGPGELEKAAAELREMALREPTLEMEAASAVFGGGSSPGPAAAAADAGLDAFFQATCLKFIEIVAKIEALVGTVGAVAVSKLPPNHELRAQMKQIILLASSSPVHRDELCLLMSQRLMQGLYRTDSVLLVDMIILLLLKIFEFSSKAAKEVTSWVIFSTDERKYSVLATASLFGSGLVYVLDFDTQLAKQVEGGKEAAIDFAVSLIRKCVFEEPPVAAPYDFVYTLEALGKVLQRSPSRASAINGLMDAITAKVREPQSEPQQLRDQITFTFTDWFRLCQYPSISDKLMASFVSNLYQREFLRTEASTRSFLRTCIEVSVELYMRQRRAPAILAYRSVDALAKLVGQLLRWRPASVQAIASIEVVTCFHLIAGEILIQGFEQGIDYLQKPFGRLFASLGAEFLESEKYLLDELSQEILMSTSTFYLTISPRLLPQFTFAWVELITHRGFMPRLLFAPKKNGWPILARLFSEFISFASPFLVAADVTEAALALYRGIMRAFLVVAHDMPDFFIAYHLQFCGLIPLRCIQLRNIVLSASPAGVPTPNPLRPDLKVDLLPEMGAPPNIHYDYIRLLEETRMNPASSLKAELDRALAGSVMIGPFCADLASFLETAASRSQLLVQNTVFYISMNGLGCVQAGEAPGLSLGRSTSMALISGLIDGLQAELRYTVLASLIDQLRYPNRHTHYFSYVVLYLFAESAGEQTKEQITRILVERLISHKPHPWGILVTYIELVKNAHYKFWEYRFTHATPEVEAILRTLTQTCLATA